MLEVNILMIPHSDRSKTKVLYSGTITNDGTGKRSKMGVMTRGNYIIKLFNKNNHMWKNGRVENFPRNRLNAWYLLYLALDNIFNKQEDANELENS